MRLVDQALVVKQGTLGESVVPDVYWIWMGSG
jgi:hypothetical protein